MTRRRIHAEGLGAAAFRHDHGTRLAYVAGAMVKGIASPAVVVRMARSGCLAFLGSGGLRLEAVEAAIQEIRTALPHGEPYGVNLLSNPVRPDKEMALVDLLLRLGVRTVEASAFMQATPAVVRFRLSGLRSGERDALIIPNRVVAKVSRPEVASLFLAPPPAAMVQRLLQDGLISEEAALLANRVPLASDLCIEADSGGHTDMGVMSVLLPSMLRLRDSVQHQWQFANPVRVGAGGGIGTPEAAACAFLLGADFIATGSINQCTVEAATSDAVKDMLEAIDVQDTAYAPAGDTFEHGSKIQVLRKGVFFPAKANKLYDLWRTHGSIDAIDAATQRQLQDKYFGRSFEEVFRETRQHYATEAMAELERAERNPKARMALIFRWYFVRSMRLALEGDREHAVDFQVHCGPALGAFNQWVKGSSFENWRNRHVDEVAERLMEGCADYLQHRLSGLAA